MSDTEVDGIKYRKYEVDLKWGLEKFVFLASYEQRSHISHILTHPLEIGDWPITRSKENLIAYLCERGGLIYHEINGMPAFRSKYPWYEEVKA